MLRPALWYTGVDAYYHDGCPMAVGFTVAGGFVAGARGKISADVEAAPMLPERLCIGRPVRNHAVLAARLCAPCPVKSAILVPPVMEGAALCVSSETGPP